MGDPDIANELVRRHGGLAPLPHARQEVVQASEILTDSRVFVGAEATKANILANWSSAGTIYYAGHVVREENVPYLTMIPIAEEPRTTRPADEILEAADILQANLSRCDLVVLSGCASGAPYVEDSITAPGLGDAFLDAGARNVAQTLWQVEDETAAPVMLGLVRALGGGDGHVRNLTAVQRRLAAGIGPMAHPYVWGACGLVSTVPTTD